MRIEVLIDVKTVLGEGPLWDVDEQRLYFIDSFGCNVFRCTADGREVRAWDVPAKIGSMALRRRGGAVLSLANGFHFLDFKSGETQLIVDPEPDKPANRINDGKVDKRGRFVAGSMDTMEDGPNGALYRLDPDLSVHKLEDRIIVSNGPCFKQTNLRESRSLERRRRRWLDRRRRGLPMERAGLRRKDRPLYAGRQDRSRHRHAGQEGDQRDVRRAKPRCPLCDVDGQATPTSFSRRWRSTREPVRNLRSCNSRRA